VRQPPIILLWGMRRNPHSGTMEAVKGEESRA